jgi:hypothetical protein
MVMLRTHGGRNAADLHAVKRLPTDMNKGYQITLGKDWARFVHRRLADVELLGVVTCGAQIGALGQLADGRFVQINGDWVTPLNASRVRRTLGLLRRHQAQPMHHQVARAPAPTTPVEVTVRKRRTVVMPAA